MITTKDWLLVRHDEGPARRAPDVDGPTHRSFARLESNGRPCHKAEIRVATVATAFADHIHRFIAGSVATLELRRNLAIASAKLDRHRAEQTKNEAME